MFRVFFQDLCCFLCWFNLLFMFKSGRSNFCLREAFLQISNYFSPTGDLQVSNLKSCSFKVFQKWELFVDHSGLTLSPQLIKWYICLTDDFQFRNARKLWETSVWQVVWDSGSHREPCCLLSGFTLNRVLWYFTLYRLSFPSNCQQLPSINFSEKKSHQMKRI